MRPHFVSCDLMKTAEPKGRGCTREMRRILTAASAGRTPGRRVKGSERTEALSRPGWSSALCASDKTGAVEETGLVGPGLVGPGLVGPVSRRGRRCVRERIDAPEPAGSGLGRASDEYVAME